MKNYENQNLELAFYKTYDFYLDSLKRHIDALENWIPIEVGKNHIFDIIDQLKSMANKFDDIFENVPEGTADYLDFRYLTEYLDKALDEYRSPEFMNEDLMDDINEIILVIEQDFWVLYGLLSVLWTQKYVELK